MEVSRAVPVEDASRIGEARREAASLARSLGYSQEDASRVSIVASELATNLHRHASSGRWFIVRQLQHEAVPGIEMLSLDTGPGIGNVAQARTDGFSTSGGHGQGLGAISRMADHFEVQTTGAGSAILARVYAEGAQPRGPAIGAVLVPKSGETECGDGWSVHEDRECLTLLVADGLGHGPEAAVAARAAVESFQQATTRTATALVARVHEALRPTRGAAIAVARIERASRLLRYAGLGNISAVIASDQGLQSLVSMHGTAGKYSGRISEFEYALPADAVVLMHSDGLTSRWDLERHPGLFARHPSIIAGVLFRDYARGRDDACVVAYRVAA